MISYEQYENKIKKLAKFKSFLFKFKFLFIGIFALIVAAITTLLCLKGTFSGEIEIASSVYGDSFEDPKGVSAFMSSVSYEYSVAGKDEWMSAKPVLAGSYEVRAVSSGISSKKYGKITPFTIAPREVDFKILSDDVEYGSTPQEISYTLLKDDILDESALLFEYDDYTAEITGVDLNESSVKVTHGAEDRSACYSFRHEKKQLSVTKRSIEITLAEGEYFYCGAPVESEGIASDQTVQRLASGDEIVIDRTKLSYALDGEKIESAVNADTYSVAAESECFKIYKTVGSERIDVTSQYDASCLSVPFTIQKRPITVTTPSASKSYDGEELTKTEGFTVNGLLSGDEFKVTVSTHFKDVQWENGEVASVPNEFTDYEIVRGSGPDLKNNYTVYWVHGTLTVNPRPITVTSASPDPWEYDGIYHSESKVSCEDALFTVLASDTPLTQIRTVQTVDNVVEYSILDRDTSQPHNKANFSLNEVWGKLQITPRAVTVKIDSMSKMYDGEELKATPENGKAYALQALADGDTLFSGNKVHSITNVEESGSNSSEYVIKCGEEDRTGNYEITYERGDLTITKRTIRVETARSYHVYTGQPYSDTSYTATCTQGGEGMIGSDRLTPVTWATVTNVSEGPVVNVCEYSASGNYEIVEVVPGRIWITVRKIVITTLSGTFVYDGEKHSNSNYTTTYFGEGGTENGLCGDDELTLLSAPFVQYVSDGSRPNECTYNLPVSGNYELSGYAYGTLNVIPRPLTVTTATSAFLYNGEEWSDTNYIAEYIDDENVSHQGLIGTDTLTVESRASVKNVWDSGTANNVTTYTVPNGNYAIVKYNYGSLTVVARKITVDLIQLEDVFYGNTLEYSTVVGNVASIGEMGLAPNESIQVLVMFSGEAPKRVNTYTYGATSFTFYDKEGNPIERGEENYVITCADKQARILRKPVTIYLSDTVITYGYDVAYANLGNPENYNMETSDALAYDEWLSVLSVDFLIDEYLVGKPRISAGLYEDVVRLSEGEETYSINGSYDDSNYDFTFVEADLTVEQRVLTIKMLDAETYYGEEISKDVGPNSVYPDGFDNVVSVYEHPMSHEVNGLLEGDRCRIISVNYLDTDVFVAEPGSTEQDFYVTPHDAGKYYIKPYEIWIYPADWGGDDSRIEKTKDEIGSDDPENANYQILFYDPGTLTVHPRPVRVTLNGIDGGSYDGEKRDYTAGGEQVKLELSKAEKPEKIFTTFGLVEGEILNVGVTFTGERIFDKPKYAGEYSYNFDAALSTIAKDDGSGTLQTVEKGIENYAFYVDAGTFTIAPRNIQVTMNDLVLTYGDELRYPDENNCAVTGEIQLVSEDRLYIDHTGILFDCGEKPQVGTYPIIGQKAYFGSTEAGDISDCYTVNFISGTLTINELPVTIKVFKEEKTYGQALQGNGFEVAPLPLPYEEVISLKYAYRIAGTESFDEAFSPRNAVDYDVLLTCRLNPDNDRLKNYIVTLYDEEMHELRDSILANGLKITKYDLPIRIPKIDITYGDSRPEEIKAEYGKPLPYDEVLGLTTHYAREGVTVFPKFAGTYDITVDGYLINGAEEGVNNYNIQLVNNEGDGTLQIAPLEITATIDDLTVTYGDPVAYESGEDGTHFTLNKELVYGDLISIFTAFDCGDRPDVGTYAVMEDSRTLTDQFGNESVNEYGFEYVIADSYTVHVEEGTLTVEKRPITITLNDVESVVYDGLQHLYDASRMNEATNMAEGEELQVAVTYEFLSPDGENLVAVEESEVGKAGVYRFAFDAANSIVIDGGAKGLDNYMLPETVEKGFFTISPRTLHVRIKSMDERAYGLPVIYESSTENWTYKDNLHDMLVEGETLEIKVRFYQNHTFFENGTILKVGDYVITNSEEDPVVTGGDYASYLNYNYHYTKGSVKVVEREIVVTLSDVTAEYGDQPVYPEEAGNYKELSVALYENETLTVKGVQFINLPENTPEGTYTGAVAYSAAQVLLGEEDVTDNYVIRGVNGSLTVEKRTLLLTTASYDFVYNGSAQKKDGYTLTHAGNPEKAALVYGAVSEISSTVPTMTDVQDDPVENKFDVIIKLGGTDVSGNYTIQTEYGTLTMSALDLYIKTASQSKVYDGEALVSEEKIDSCYYYVDNDETKEKVLNRLALDSHKYRFKSVSVTDANENSGGEVNDNIEDIVDGTGHSQLTNYNPIFEEGRLTIYARKIYVNASSAEKIYDGVTLYSPDDNYKLEFYPDNDKTKTPVYGDAILVAGNVFGTKEVSILNYGTIPNNKYFIQKSATEPEVVSGEGKNYVFVQESGYLTVNKRPARVSFGNIQMVYSNVAPGEAPTVTREAENAAKKRGILAADDTFINFEICFYKSDGYTPVQRFNAGSYKISANPVNSDSAPVGGGTNNYSFEFVQGDLKIERARLVVIPHGAQAQYEGFNQTISIPTEPIYLEGTALASGDVLSKYELSRSSVSAKEGRSITAITYKVFTIADETTGEANIDDFAINDNYEITLLRSEIEFLTRTLYMVQSVPAGYERVAYTGVKRFIPNEGASFYTILNPDEVDSAAERAEWVGIGAEYDAATYGLAPGDEHSFGSAYVGISAGIYTQWVYPEIRNTTYSMKRMYNIIPVSPVGVNTFIEVVADEVNVAFHASLTDSVLQSVMVKSVPILPSGYYDVTGLRAGDVLEVGVFANGSGYELKVFVYKKSSMSGGALRRIDLSDSYQVNCDVTMLSGNVSAAMRSLDEYPKVLITFTSDFTFDLVKGLDYTLYQNYLIDERYIESKDHLGEDATLVALVEKVGSDRFRIRVFIYEQVGDQKVDLKGEYEVAANFEGEWGTSPAVVLRGLEEVSGGSFDAYPLVSTGAVG